MLASFSLFTGLSDAYLIFTGVGNNILTTRSSYLALFFDFISRKKGIYRFSNEKRITRYC
jgi:hypothetical protein